MMCFVHDVFTTKCHVSAYSGLRRPKPHSICHWLQWVMTALARAHSVTQQYARRVAVFNIISSLLTIRSGWHYSSLIDDAMNTKWKYVHLPLKIQLKPIGRSIRDTDMDHISTNISRRWGPPGLNVQDGRTLIKKTVGTNEKTKWKEFDTSFMT